MTATDSASKTSPGGFGTAPAVGHGGSKDGYQSLMAVIPDQQAVIVVFVNQRDADVTSIASRRSRRFGSLRPETDDDAAK